MRQVQVTGPVSVAGSTNGQRIIRVGWNFSVLALLAVTAVIYGELIPFRFTAGAGTGGMAEIVQRLHFHASSLEDTATNILIFVPVGLLMTLHFARGSGRWWPAISAGFVFCAALGACMEMLQTHLPVRVASGTDVLNNGLGGLCGATAAPLFHRYWRRGRCSLAMYLAVCPHHVMWLALSGVVCVAALAPFDLSFSIARLKTGILHAQWWPLGGQREQFLAASGGDARLLLLSGLRQAGIFAALAFLGVRSLREMGHGPVVAVLVTARRVLALAVGLECVQVLTGSHTFEVLDILLELFGALMGVWVVGLADGFGRHRAAPGRTSFNNRAPVVLGLLGCVLYQSGVTLASSGVSVAGGSQASFVWLPFEGEFFTPTFLAVTSIAQRFIGFSAAALLMLIALRRVRAPAGRWAVVALMLLWACLLEAGRWGLAGRLADTSGPVLAVTAAMLCVLGLAWAHRLAASARRSVIAATATPRRASLA